MHMHVPPFNHRKRKADHSDDAAAAAAPPTTAATASTPSSSSSSTSTVTSDSSTVVVVVQDVPTTSTAPRQPWLAGSSWPPSSPQVSSPLSAEVIFSSLNPPKRPRLQKIETNSKKLSSRKSATSIKPCTVRPPPPSRLGSDIEDLGLVSAADPGPSSGSLLHLRASDPSSSSSSSTSPVLPFVPFDTNSHHIPSLHPLVNRQTLKELDLDVILRNPQLRHDLLFDPGLQFRPTSSRRKRAMCEGYWSAVIQQVETGCTCVSFDCHGKPHPVVCACTQVPIPPAHPVVAYSSARSVLTLRMPSRINNLLTEFLQVLLLVIQPLSSVSGMYVNPNTFKTQMQEHSAQAAYIRSIFDPVLIEQELKHELFDPSGLFSAIGTILKGHCAPMRDRAVEAMVQAAKACAPGGSGSKRDAVNAVRMCLEILELMKLDIANHQLQTLRPFLMRTSGQFELKAFRNRKGVVENSLQLTREWLRAAHQDMLARGPISHLKHPSGSLEYSTLPRNQQTYIAVLKGIVDLVFEPPPLAVSPSTPSSCTPPPTPVLHHHSSSSSPLSSQLKGHPETAYLDSARLGLLSGDAADNIALCMFLLLFRQLVHSDPGDPPPSPSELAKIGEADLLRLKSEICDIGSGRLGYCLSSCSSSSSSSFPSKSAHVSDEDNTTAAATITISPVGSPKSTTGDGRWVKRDIVLQIAKRAKEARSLSTTNTTPFTQPFSPVGEAPDESVVSLAQRWADSNMNTDSPLCKLLRRRIRDVVFNSVVALSYPGYHTGANFSASTRTSTTGRQLPPSCGTATGMEPIAEEIRSLSEKISRLALIHMNTYLPLYEQNDFLLI